MNKLFTMKMNRVSLSKKKVEMPDTYTSDILRTRFNAFMLEVETTKAIRDKTALPIRCQNPPEDITENIVKFVIRNFEGDNNCMWAKSIGKKGDLISGSVQKEVKAFMSSAPCTFGPRKVFDVIYFLDIRAITDDVLEVWRVNLTSESPEWKNMKINATETFADQCNQRRRPHIPWEDIRSQIADHCTSLYRGSFEGIFTAVAPVVEPLA